MSAGNDIKAVLAHWLFLLSRLNTHKMGSAISSRFTKHTPTEPTASSKPVAMNYFPAAQSQKPPLIANENAFLGDVASSYVSIALIPSKSLKAFDNRQALDAVAPMSAGFYRLEKGTPLVYSYTYHEMKIIVEGEFNIADETGNKVHAVKGDVFYFPKGSTSRSSIF